MLDGLLTVLKLVLSILLGEKRRHELWCSQATARV